jgi:hypothetical protein
MTDTQSPSRFRPDRRKFLTGVALGAGLAPLATLVTTRARAGAAAAAGSLCYSTVKPALAASDFAYLGYYDIQTDGNNTTYARCLTHRYVNGQLRFLTLTVTGELQEFVPAGAFGQLINQKTRSWNISSVIGDFTGIWWDEPGQRLWVTSSIDYGSAATYYPTSISTLTLNDSGSVGNVKTVSLQGVNSKRVYGGALAVPSWFQSQYKVGPYAVGFGGYTSLIAQTSRASLGPELICIPDVASYANGAEIPSSAFKVLLDTDTSNRGVRATIPLNYFDGGDPRQNPTTAPTSAPASSGNWLSPNAQGLGWMVWGDSYYNNAVWIDGPNKQGFAAVASLGKGKCWYGSSTLHFDDRQYELHIWDSAVLNNGLTTRPTSMKELVLPRGVVPQPWEGDVSAGNISGVTYDPVTSRLYAVGYPLGADIYTGRLYAYSVAA